MRTLVTLLLVLGLVIFPACSTRAQEESLYQEAAESFMNGDLDKARESATLLVQKYPSSEKAAEAKILLADIETALQRKREAEEAARIQQYITESESCRQQVVDAYGWLSKQYSSLASEYEKQRRSLDYVEWSVLLHDWNGTLKTYRGQLDGLKVNGHTPNLFWAWQRLQYAAGLMNGNIWQCYDNVLLGKNSDLFGREDLVYFDKEINTALAEAKEALDTGG
jgi:outer membrane protein assembly factor BamD (BamD/ComL family)